MLRYLLKTGYNTMKVDHYAERLEDESGGGHLKGYFEAERKIRTEQEERIKLTRGFYYFDDFIYWG